MSNSSEPINGILLLHHDRLSPDASTVMEHVGAFKKFSRFNVWNVNTFLGFPKSLTSLRFEVILLHYSLFGGASYCLDEEFLNYLEQCQASYKIAFFQDEFQFCNHRFDFLNRYRIDSVYTLLEHEYFKDVYQKYTNVSKVTYNIPGYVSDQLIKAARQMAVPDDQRSIDIGYRGRKLPRYMGRGSQEKYEIAVRFKERAKDLGLKLDIEAEEQGRLYGDDWYLFMANCRGVLGVEAGVSIYDLNDEVYTEYCRAVLNEEPEPPGNTWYPQLVRLAAKEATINAHLIAEKLDKWEGNIPYRTISPRHFEAAAFRVCQILFEGKYSGIMLPLVHYIPLKKDFSNFEEVIRIFRDNKQRREITENAYRDMIASGSYSYRRFISGFDQDLLASGVRPHRSVAEKLWVNALLRPEEIRLRARWVINQARSKNLFGRSAAKRLLR